VKLIHRSTSGRLPTSSFDFVSDAGAVIGCTQVRHRPSRNEDLPPEAANHIYYEIKEPYRGRGYGKTLLALALIEARRIGLERVRLTVGAENLASKRIIENNGGRWVADFRSWGHIHLYEISLLAHEDSVP
jgi:predicted acetyltransferase